MGIRNFSGLMSFGSMTLMVGGLALFSLLLWGWVKDEPLPLWPALLVAAVNFVDSIKLIQETKAKRAAEQAAQKRKGR